MKNSENYKITTRQVYDMMCLLCGKSVKNCSTPEEAEREYCYHQQYCYMDPRNQYCGSCRVYDNARNAMPNEEEYEYGVPDYYNYKTYRICNELNIAVEANTPGCRWWRAAKEAKENK